MKPHSHDGECVWKTYADGSERYKTWATLQQRAYRARPARAPTARPVRSNRLRSSSEGNVGSSVKIPRFGSVEPIRGRKSGYL